MVGIWGPFQHSKFNKGELCEEKSKDLTLILSLLPTAYFQNVFPWDVFVLLNNFRMDNGTF